jgi:hypothetical protein
VHMQLKDKELVASAIKRGEGGDAGTRGPVVRRTASGGLLLDHSKQLSNSTILPQAAGQLCHCRISEAHSTAPAAQAKEPAKCNPVAHLYGVIL